MSFLKKAIKDNIMTSESKYKYDDEKVGQVIEAIEGEKICTIFLITRDGVSSVEYNVPVIEGKFPKVGDMVKVKEQFKKFTIVGIYDKLEFETILEGDIFPSTYSGSVNGYVGYL